MVMTFRSSSNKIVQSEIVLLYPDPENSQKGAILHRCGACLRASDAKVRMRNSRKAVLGRCQCVCVFVCLCVFLTLFPSGAPVYIYLQAFFPFVCWNIKGDIHSFFVTSRRWANGELFFQRQ